MGLESSNECSKVGFQFDDVQEWGFSSSLFKSGALKVGEFKMFKCETLEFRMSKVGFYSSKCQK